MATTTLRRLAAFGAPVALGALLLFFAVANRSTPEQAPVTERAQAVRVMTVQPQAFTPEVRGFGEVAPGKVWEAVAQVAGPIEAVHPDLQSGNILQKGTEIIRISKDQYEIALRQAQADLAAAEANLGELQAQIQNNEASLKIEENALVLARADLERKRSLLNRGATSQANVDTSQTSVLTQEARVQDLKNAIRLSRSQMAAQQSQIDANRTRIEAAELDLARTVIKMPFTARIASETVEATQFVSVGTTMVTADGIDVAEIETKIPQNQMAGFVDVSLPDLIAAGNTVDFRDGNALARTGWTAEVRLEFNGRNASWPAKVVRTADTIDLETRTVGIIVAVENPYGAVQPGVRPPLTKGMFVETIVRGKARDDVIAVPRSAVRDGVVFLMDEENRLRRRAVKVATEQGQLAIIADGLSGGEILVLSDVAPAIDGMLLNGTSVDQDRADTAASQALGSKAATSETVVGATEQAQ